MARQHQVHSLRVRLSDALASGRADLDLAEARGTSPAELRRRLDRTRVEAAAVDSQRLLLLSERDPSVYADALPATESRVTRVSALVRRLRAAVSTVLVEPSDDALVELSLDMDREVAALDAGLRELHALHAGHDLTESPAERTVSHAVNHTPGHADSSRTATTPLPGRRTS